MSESSNNRWLITGISLLVILTIVASLYGDTVAYLTSVWKQWEIGDYGHGYLVLGISAYLVFRKRDDLTLFPPCPSLVGLLPLGASGLMWLLAMLTDVQILQSLALFCLVIAIVWSLQGGRATKTILFPLLFLFLALPIWSVITPMLQGLTADAVFFLTRLIDIPALREENFIVLPAGKLSIEEACSGLRFVLAATMLGALFAYLNYSSVVSRVTIMSLAIAGAVVMNIIRVLIVVILAYRTDMKHPLVNDHLTLGWYLFAGLVAILLFIEYLAYRAGFINHERDATIRMPEKKGSEIPCATGFTKQALVTFVATLLVIVWPLALDFNRVDGSAVKSNNVANAFPIANGDWRGPEGTEDRWLPVFQGADGQKREYESADQTVFLYIAYYADQTQGQELINDLNIVSGTETWELASAGQQPVETAGGEVLWQLLVSKSGEQRLVYYWYNVAGFETASAYMAKLLQLYGLFTGDTGASAVLLATNVKSNDLDGAHRTLEEFLLLHRMPIQHLLPDIN